MAEQKKQEQDLNQLLKVRRDKLADLQANGKDPFKIVKFDVTHHSQEIKDHFEELENRTVTIAGRMMSKRVMGKASFCHVQDLEGTIQSYVARDNLGEEPYKDFKKLDVGDIVGIKGEVFKTKTGEISIHASRSDAVIQEPSGTSGKIPWTDQYGSALSSEICRFDHESGSKGYLYQTFQNPKCYP